MSNILGPYYSPWHWRKEDMDYVRALQPAWARIHQPVARAISEVQQAAPNANIMLRSWDIDDHNGDRHREVYADPNVAALRHMDLWHAKLASLETELQRNGQAYDKSKWYLGLLNEPDTNQLPQVVKYTEQCMRIATQRGWRLGVGVSGVGNFQKPGEGPNNWNLFKPLERAINDGGHILICHEYWQPEGPRFEWTDNQGNRRIDAGNLAWRHHHIPLNLPILIGESGANGFIYQRHTNKDDGGWQRYMQPEQYAAQVREYIEGCDERVKGVLLYMLDFHSKQWIKFDTQPAMHQLLGVKDVRPQKKSPFASVLIPGVGTAPQPQILPMPPTNPVQPSYTAYVNAIAGLNLRKGPGMEHGVWETLAHGTPVEIIGRQGDWLQTRTGWLHNDYVSTTRPPVDPHIAPPPQATGDNWQRSYAFTKKWEGGYQNVYNDSGNWTGGKVGVGELKGTNFGISAASYPHLDIRNLTAAQAEAIYKRDYWQASGADKLPWPACLIVFDTAVLHGVGRAKQWLAEAGPNPLLFAARRLRSYTGMHNWHFWGIAWTRRVADLLEASSKQ